VNTVLPTGPGAWEKLATGTTIMPNYKVLATKAFPTRTHMSFVQMIGAGLLKFLISQNTDGLHRKSGIPASMLAEIHGNTNLEKCFTCKTEYMRDFGVRIAKNPHEHLTGRKCDDPSCGGFLHDSIINFGESLPKEILRKAFQNAQESDLCLSIGSSLVVQPAAQIPLKTASKGGKLVIVNLQKTVLDRVASLVINAKCDDVMELLMKKLDLQIPEFRLIRKVRIKVEDGVNHFKTLTVRGVDCEGRPYSLFTKVEVILPHHNEIISIPSEPYEYASDFIPNNLTVRLHFQGHYNEPPYSLDLWINDMKERTYTLVFDPYQKTWDLFI